MPPVTERGILEGGPSRPIFRPHCQRWQKEKRPLRVRLSKAYPRQRQGLPNESLQEIGIIPVERAAKKSRFPKGFNFLVRSSFPSALHALSELFLCKSLLFPEHLSPMFHLRKWANPFSLPGSISCPALSRKNPQP